MKTIAFLIVLILSCTAYSNEGIAQESIKSAMLEEVNKPRASGCHCGEEYMPPAPLLEWSDLLEKAAIRHVNDMHDNNHFSHTGSDGSEHDERISDAGYRWSLAGENISYGYSTVADAVKGWLDSPGHCRNIMNPVFKEIGAAGKGNYWVMDLGKH